MNTKLNKVAGENILVFTIENEKTIMFVLNEQGNVEKIINDPQAIKNKLTGKSLEDFTLNTEIAVPVKIKTIKKTGNKYCKTKSGNSTFVIDTNGLVLKSCTSLEYDDFNAWENNSEVLLDSILFTEEQRFLYYKKKREIEALTIFENHSDEAKESPFADIKQRLKTNKSVNVSSLRIPRRKVA